MVCTYIPKIVFAYAYIVRVHGYGLRNIIEKQGTFAVLGSSDVSIEVVNLLNLDGAWWQMATVNINYLQYPDISHGPLALF